MIKEIDKNKKAYFDYYIEETIEAGIALKGSEVKSLRASDVSLRDSFCFCSQGKIVLKNCHILPYKKGSVFNEEPRRDRDLLLHKREIARLIGKVKEKGYTIVPTRLYFKEGRVKLEIALAKGKHSYDKKSALREKDIIREAQREIKNYK